MKKLSPLFAWALLSGLASAAPYIVYSGAITGDNVSSSGAANANTVVYLVTDVSDSSNFAVLLVNAATKDYSVIARPSDSPATDEATNNFLGSVGAGTSARAVLSYSIETTDSSSNTTIVRAYATGPLSARSTQLVPARKSLVVNLKTNRVANGTYTFGTPTAAILSGATPFALSFTGASHGYAIDSQGALTHATTSGALALRENPVLTGLANIGGGYGVNATTEIAVMPVAIGSGQSESDAFVAWLSAFAQANGWTVPSSGASAGLTLDSYSGGTSVDSGSLSIGGSISSGVSISVGGGGTLTLNGRNPILTGVNPGDLNSSSLASSPLVFGGLGTGTTTSSTGSSTPITFNLGGTSTLTLIDTGTLNLSGGLTILSGGGNYGPGISSAGPGSPIVASQCTIEITSINGNTVSGTITNSALPSNTIGFSTIAFSNAALVLDGTSGVSGVSVGQTLTGIAQLDSGTSDFWDAGVLLSRQATYTGGTIAITTSAVPAAISSTGTVGTSSGTITNIGIVNCGDPLPAQGSTGGGLSQ